MAEVGVDLHKLNELHKMIYGQAAGNGGRRPGRRQVGIRRLMTRDSEVISLKSRTLVQVGARSTAALASTMPKPYSWLKL